ncbi:7-carboxy-7-deazaguanine synthase QueE [Marinicrinis lubricantis]|uniref:7-carboxy-7-deazaguanine synthase n=1 Tax=Marinicrinis lubricantis TaxID=2086470 RepID=A0ABW1IJW9_9BACL
MGNERIPVLEIFGPTVQGEGMVIGQKTMFVRTAGCDYRCAWCDSAFTWDGSASDDIRLMTAEEIVSELRSIGGRRFAHVTLSGGNPGLLKPLGGLIRLLHEQQIKVALETQGSRWQEWFIDVDELTLSPKPPSSQMATDWEVLDDMIERLRKNGSDYSLKVVVFDEADLQYALDTHQRYPDVPMYLQSGNASVTETDQEKLLEQLRSRYEWLIDQVMQSEQWKCVKVLPQLHAWVWGNKRGV